MLSAQRWTRKRLCNILPSCQDVQVKFGADVTLQCQITTDERISVVKWSRPDLNTDGYVYFYRNKRFYENYQHPSFHGRVKLRDPEMKDGDVSLILNNVTFNDTGMYECHIAVRNPVRSKRAHTEISHFIDLTVTGEFVELTLSSHIIKPPKHKSVKLQTKNLKLEHPQHLWRRVTKSDPLILISAAGATTL
uniref:Ig-like domain-containing protein n=1 Tax=Neolamprologus brichardi TaxID=32507 RepID=A0A3Q4GKZ6_NEOBR